MKKMKHIPILIIAAGLTLTGYGGWKVADTKMKTERSLEEAREVTSSDDSAGGAEVSQEKSRLQAQDRRGKRHIEDP